MRPTIVVSEFSDSIHEWAIENDWEYRTFPNCTTIYQSRGPVSLSPLQITWLGSKGISRVFESCFLQRTDDDEVRKQLVQSLFSTIGTVDYCAGITKRVNVGCYETMLEGVFSRSSASQTRTLDVGCGPGTILESTVPQQVSSILGFDLVAENRMIALSRGLNAVSEDELRTLQEGSIDIALASFVLHYQSLTAQDFSAVAAALAPAGIWSGNFHKSVGIDWFTRNLSSCGVFDDVFVEDNDVYGPIVYARKRS